MRGKIKLIGALVGVVLLLGIGVLIYVKVVDNQDQSEKHVEEAVKETDKKNKEAVKDIEGMLGLAEDEKLLTREELIEIIREWEETGELEEAYKESMQTEHGDRAGRISYDENDDEKRNYAIEAKIGEEYGDLNRRAYREGLLVRTVEVNGKMPTDEYEKKQIAIALGVGNVHPDTHPEYEVTNPVENTQDLRVDRKRWDKMKDYQQHNPDEYENISVFMKDTEGMEEYDGIKAGYFGIKPQKYDEAMANFQLQEEGYTQEEVNEIYQPLAVVTVKVEEDMNIKEAREMVSKIKVNGKDGLNNFDRKVEAMVENGIKEKDIKLISDSYLEINIGLPYEDIGIEGQDYYEKYENLVEKDFVTIEVNGKEVKIPQVTYKEMQEGIEVQG